MLIASSPWKSSEPGEAGVLFEIQNQRNFWHLAARCRTAIKSVSFCHSILRNCKMKLNQIPARSLSCLIVHNYHMELYCLLFLLLLPLLSMCTTSLQWTATERCFKYSFCCHFCSLVEFPPCRNRRRSVPIATRMGMISFETGCANLHLLKVWCPYWDHTAARLPVRYLLPLQSM